MPTMGTFLRHGASADGRRPADPGAAQHRRRLVHASRPAPGPACTARRTTRSTSTAQPFGNRTAAFDAERAAGRVDRPGGRARRAEGRAGRVGRWAQRRRSRARPSTSGVPLRAAAWRRTSSAPRASRCSTTPPFITSFGLQFDHPAGYAGQAPFPGAAPTPATGWTGNLPPTFSPAMEMRLRVLDAGVDKYGLNAYIFDSTNDGATELRQGAVLAHQGRRRRRGDLCPRASGPTSR